MFFMLKYIWSPSYFGSAKTFFFKDGSPKTFFHLFLKELLFHLVFLIYGNMSGLYILLFAHLIIVLLEEIQITYFFIRCTEIISDNNLYAKIC